MIVIRLTRVGKKKQPSYRIVVQEKHKDPWGKTFEIVGQYNPRTEPKTVILKEDSIKRWLSKGAQPSPSVHNILVDAKVITEKKLKASSGSSTAGTKDAKKAEAAK